MLDFSQKTIVVTGSASGIGAATVAFLKARGARVIGLDIRRDEVSDAFIEVDLGARKSIDAAVAKLPARLDGLANIAGLAPNVPAADVIRVNLVGTLHLTENVVPRLSDGAGIVMLSSIAAFHWRQSIEQIREALALGFGKVDAFVARHGIDAQPGRSYFLTKEALTAWCVRERRTWIDRRIRVNSVAPAAVSTPLLDAFASVMGERTQSDSEIVERSGTPADIAPVIAFLLSDDAAWIRGVNLPADGGVAAHYLAQENGL